MSISRARVFNTDAAAATVTAPSLKDTGQLSCVAHAIFKSNRRYTNNNDIRSGSREAHSVNLDSSVGDWRDYCCVAKKK